MKERIKKLKEIGRSALDLIIKRKKTKRKKVENPYANIPNPDSYFKETFTINTVNQDLEAAETLKTILSEIAESGEYFRKIGDVDGQYGVEEKSMHSIVRNAALRTRAYIETIFLGQRDGVKSELEAKQVLLDYAKKDFENEDANLEREIKAKQWKPKSYFLFLGFLYVLIGVGLIYADVVISLKTGADIFELNDRYEELGMAIGIALCTIYIKIYFDLYFLPSIEKSVTTFKKENLPGCSDDIEEIKKIKRVWNYRLIFHTLLFILCITTIVFLGISRFNLIEPEIIKDLIELETIKSKDEYKRNIYNILSFILVSLLFPLIGGICTAIGIHKIGNSIIIRKAKSQFNKSKERYNEAQKEVSLLNKRLNNYESYVSWCSVEGTFIADNTDFFYACYNHGYDYGFQKQTAQLDLYERAKQMRKQFAARNSRLALLPVN